MIAPPRETGDGEVRFASRCVASMHDLRAQILYCTCCGDTCGLPIGWTRAIVVRVDIECVQWESHDTVTLQAEMTRTVSTDDLLYKKVPTVPYRQLVQYRTCDLKPRKRFGVLDGVSRGAPPVGGVQNMSHILPQRQVLRQSSRAAGQSARELLSKIFHEAKYMSHRLFRSLCSTTLLSTHPPKHLTKVLSCKGIIMRTRICSLPLAGKQIS